MHFSRLAKLKDYFHNFKSYIYLYICITLYNKLNIVLLTSALNPKRGWVSYKRVLKRNTGSKDVRQMQKKSRVHAVNTGQCGIQGTEIINEMDYFIMLKQMSIA